jgi:dTDP-4-dehydrorhamnose 3,5-epimerase
MFTDGDIQGVIVKELRYFNDKRGWLVELFRQDELPPGFAPEMSYISMTRPGVARGPHEHVRQTDYFCFLSNFTLYLWDARANSGTHMRRMCVTDTKDRVFIVPPGVVHAYKNTSDSDGLVINLPDRLFAGRGKTEKVDEIRYEDDPGTPYIID